MRSEKKESPTPEAFIKVRNLLDEALAMLERAGGNGAVIELRRAIAALDAEMK